MNIAQIFRNAATNYGTLAVSIASAFILTPFLLHRLGPEAYGAWAVSQAIASYFGLLDLGVTSAAGRYIAHYRALDDWENLNLTIGSSLIGYTGMAVLALLLGPAIAAVSPLIFPHLAMHFELQCLICSTSVVAALGFLSVIPVQCVIAAQRQDLLNKCLLLIQVTSAVATFLCVSNGSGVLGLAFVQVAGSACTGLAGYLLMRKLMPRARLRLNWHPEQGRQVIQYAGWSFFTSIAVRLIYFTDSLVIGGFISVAAVAGYSVILKIVDLLRGGANAGVSVLGTFASAQSAIGDQNSLGKMWIYGSKFALIICTPVTLACILIPHELITAWIGKSTRDYEIALMWIATAALLDVTQSAAYQILVNTGRHKEVAITFLCEGLCNLVLSIALVSRLGVVGVAIGTFIPSVIRTTLVFPALMVKITHVKTLEYVARAIAPALLTAFPPCLLIAGYRVFGWHQGRMTILILIAGCGLVLAASAVAFGFDACERKKLLSFFHPKSPVEPVSEIEAVV